MRRIAVIRADSPYAGTPLDYDDATGTWYFAGKPVPPDTVRKLRPFLVGPPPAPAPVPASPPLLPPPPPLPEARKRPWLAVVSSLLAVALLLPACGTVALLAIASSVASNSTSVHSDVFASQEPVWDEAEGYSLATQGHFSALMHPRPLLEESSVVTTEVAGRKMMLAGWFDPEEDSIHIVVPAGSRSIRLTYLETLRHEYGHAFMQDWLLREAGSDYDADRLHRVLYRVSPDGSPLSVESLPEGLKPAAAEYLDEPGHYGDYPATHFSEFMAEAFAYYVSGEDMPPAALAFFRSADGRATP